MRRILVVVALAAVVAVGCGGDDGGSDETATPTTSVAPVVTQPTVEVNDDVCQTVSELVDPGMVTSDPALFEEAIRTNVEVTARLAEQAEPEWAEQIQVMSVLYAEVAVELEQYNFDLGAVPGGIENSELGRRFVGAEAQEFTVLVSSIEASCA